MRALKQPTTNKKDLHGLVPLNALSEARFDEIAGKITIEVVRAGRYLFRKGERDNRTLYLLDGKVALVDDFRKVTGEIVAGSDASRHPISARQPRDVSARVTEKAVIASIDSGLLDVLLNWDEPGTVESVEYAISDAGDWMSRLLQSETFSNLPPATLQALLMKMETLEVEPGDVIVRQGDEGDYFYMIHEGRCLVTRQERPGGETVELATLSGGDAFGEEALVSSARRNASITMQTHGTLMRLSRDDFDDLIRARLIRPVDHEEALQMVADGAVWLDVRSPEEFATGSLQDSVNLPLSGLRGELPELIFNARYIVCCDNGERSNSAAIVLRHKGYDVCVLQGGLPAVDPGKPAAGLPAASAGPVTGEEPGDTGHAAGVEDARAGMDALRRSCMALTEENRKLQTERQRLEDQVELLRGELAESSGRLDELHVRVRVLDGENRALQDSYNARVQEFENELEMLTGQLEESEHRCLELQHADDRRMAEARRQRGPQAAQSGQGNAGMPGMDRALDNAQLQSRMENLEAALLQIRDIAGLPGMNLDELQRQIHELCSIVRLSPGYCGAPGSKKK